MPEPAIKSRKFLLRDARGRNVDVTAQLGRHFSITSQYGAAHEAILAAVPTDVRTDIEALIAVHLCDANGTPMHGIANASYHLREGKIDDAVRALGSVVAREDLYAVLGEATHMAADPGLVRDYLEKPKAKAQRLLAIWRDVKDGARTFVSKKEQGELLDSIASLIGRRKLEESEIAAIAIGSFDRATIERVTESLRTKVFNERIASFAATRCQPAWEARAAAAKAALDKPDYRVEGRPPIAEDPTTFEGFIAKWGLAMEVGPSRPGDTGPSSRRWTLTIRGRKDEADAAATGRVLYVDFGRGNPADPDLPMVLECLQSDFCSVLTYERDDWLTEFGFNGDIKALRKGEAAYDRVLEEQIPAFKNITGGDEALRELLTKVGDNPPLDSEDYETVMAKGASLHL
jgi:hypothetical protein